MTCVLRSAARPGLGTLITTNRDTSITPDERGHEGGHAHSAGGAYIGGNRDLRPLRNRAGHDSILGCRRKAERRAGDRRDRTIGRARAGGIGSTAHMMVSSTRSIAGCLLFLTLIQSFDRPARQGRSLRFDTIPSSPNFAPESRCRAPPNFHCQLRGLVASVCFEQLSRSLDAGGDVLQHRFGTETL